MNTAEKPVKPDNFVPYSVRFAAFFDLSYIRGGKSHLKKKSDEEVLREFVDPANKTPKRPNIIFDPVFYVEQCVRRNIHDVGNPILHFLDQGDAIGIPCNVFFDPIFYRKSYGWKQNARLNSVNQALTVGLDRNSKWHPLLDVGFAAKQLKKSVDLKLVEEILGNSELEIFDPHPLFSIEYLEKKSQKKFASTREAISFYLNSDTDIQTHFLFDVDYYREVTSNSSPDFKSLLHYLTLDNSHSPHPLFDSAYYRKNAYKKFGSITNRPLEHFLTIGLAKSIDASPYFDIDFYLKNIGSDKNAYYHYLEEFGYKSYSPHPLIDAGDYQDIIEKPDSLSKIPAVDFALRKNNEKPISIAFFDPQFYANNYPDISKLKYSFIKHFIDNGIHENRSPNTMFSEDYVLSRMRKTVLSSSSVIKHYFENRMFERKRVVFVLVNADDNRENRSAIQLISHLSEHEDIETITFLAKTGPLLGELRRVSHVYHLKATYEKTTLDIEAAEAEIDHAFSLFGTNKPIIAFCDGMETTDLSKLISNKGVPVVSFVRNHLAIERADFEEIISTSSEVVFPASFMKAQAEDLIEGNSNNLSVGGIHIPIEQIQRNLDKQTIYQEVRTKLGLAEDALIVFGSGGLDLDSGVDSFGTIARLFCQNNPDIKNVYFVWMGKGPTWPNTPYFYANQEMRLAGFSDRIIFIDGNISYEKMYLAADIYLLPVRLVPLPISILFAKAYGLPIVTNNSQTAAPDFVGQLGGLIYKETDLRSAADCVAKICSDEKFRSELALASQQSFEQNWSDDAAYRALTALMKAHASFPVRGISRRKEALLNVAVYQRGVLEEHTIVQTALKQVGLSKAHYVFLGGRFAPDIEKIRQKINARDYDIYQPSNLSDSEITRAWQTAMKEQVAQKTIFVNLENLASPTVLQGNKSYKILALTTNRIDLTALYFKGLLFDEIWVTQDDVIAKMRAMNPLIADKMVHILP